MAEMEMVKLTTPKKIRLKEENGQMYCHHCGKPIEQKEDK
jgi:hypothetical protein